MARGSGWETGSGRGPAAAPAPGSGAEPGPASGRDRAAPTDEWCNFRTGGQHTDKDCTEDRLTT